MLYMCVDFPVLKNSEVVSMSSHGHVGTNSTVTARRTHGALALPLLLANIGNDSIEPDMHCLVFHSDIVINLAYWVSLTC